MEIIKLKTSSLRNGDHYQYHFEVHDLLKDAHPEDLGIQEEFEQYGLLLSSEDLVLKKILADEWTALMAEGDFARGEIYRGMVLVVKGYRKNPVADKKEAARRIMVVIKNFGNITRLPYLEETAKTNQLIADLNTKHTADMVLIHLDEWIPLYKASNDNFAELTKNRYEEETGKTLLNIKDVRKAIDALYVTMVKQINARAVINKDPQAYASIITPITVRIEKLKHMMATRHGRLTANKDTPPATPQA